MPLVIDHGDSSNNKRSRHDDVLPADSQRTPGAARQAETPSPFSREAFLAREQRAEQLRQEGAREARDAALRQKRARDAFEERSREAWHESSGKPVQERAVEGSFSAEYLARQRLYIDPQRSGDTGPWVPSWRAAQALALYRTTERGPMTHRLSLVA